jgi:hypothetical protein
MNQEPRTFNIEINATANGYIVKPAADMQRDRYTPLCEFHVFESFDALVAHLHSRMPIYPVFTGVMTCTLTADAPPRKRK